MPDVFLADALQLRLEALQLRVAGLQSLRDRALEKPRTASIQTPPPKKTT